MTAKKSELKNNNGEDAEITKQRKKSRKVVSELKKTITEVQQSGRKTLSDEDKQRLRDALQLLQDRVEGEIDFLRRDGQIGVQKGGQASESIFGGMHMADHGTENFDREFALNMVSTEHDILYEINDALRRIDDGSYGTCQECEGRIELARLEALPFARMCIRCKSEKEKGSVRYRPMTRTQPRY